MTVTRAPLLDRLVSASLARLVVLVLLATIGIQAASPAVGVELTHGSAFSATTYECAVTRRSESGAALDVPLPALPPVPLSPIPIARAAAAIAAAPHVAPRDVRPVAILALLPGPRAPPIPA